MCDEKGNAYLSHCDKFPWSDFTNTQCQAPSIVLTLTVSAYIMSNAKYI